MTVKKNGPLKISDSLPTQASLALALAIGGTAVQAKDTDVPPSPALEKPVPAEPAPAEPAAEPAPTNPTAEPATDEPEDADGDGLDDITGEPIPEDSGTSPDPQQR